MDGKFRCIRNDYDSCDMDNAGSRGPAPKELLTPDDCLCWPSFITSDDQQIFYTHLNSSTTTCYRERSSSKIFLC